MSMDFDVNRFLGHSGKVLQSKKIFEELKKMDENWFEILSKNAENGFFDDVDFDTTCKDEQISIIRPHATRTEIEKSEKGKTKNNRSAAAADDGENDEIWSQANVSLTQAYMSHVAREQQDLETKRKQTVSTTKLPMCSTPIRPNTNSSSSFVPFPRQQPLSTHRLVNSHYPSSISDFLPRNRGNRSAGGYEEYNPWVKDTMLPPLQINVSRVKCNRSEASDAGYHSNFSALEEPSATSAILANTQHDLDVLNNLPPDFDFHSPAAKRAASDVLQAGVGCTRKLMFDSSVCSEADNITDDIFTELCSTFRIDPEDTSVDKPSTSPHTKSKDFEAIEQVGFTTASKKPIRISADSMKKADALLNDLDPSLDECKNQPGFSAGFTTASKKPIKTSDASLKKAEELFKDLDSSLDGADGVDPIAAQSHSSFSVGFSTAGSKKPIKVSDESVVKANQLFSNIEESCNVEAELNAVSFSVGFSTANKKPIKISADSMKAADSLLKDIDNSIGESPLVKVNFTTAGSKKPISASESATRKARKLFDELNTSPVVAKKRRRNCFKPPKPVDKPRCSSLSGRKPVTKCGVNSAENSSFGTTRRQSSVNECSTSTDYPIQDKPSFSVGFSTASKKPIKISDASLKKAEGLFKSIHEEPEEKLELGNQSGGQSNFTVGFSTASKKSIAISDASLKKAGQIFQDLESLTDYPLPGVDDCATAKQSESSGVGFPNANNDDHDKRSLAACCDTSFEMSENLLKALDASFSEEIPSSSNKNQSDLASVSFTTASENPMKVSTDSTEKGDGLLKDTDFLFGEPKVESELKFSVGFSTASKKPIKISDACLKKAEGLFKSIHEEPEVKSELGTQSTCQSNITKAEGFFKTIDEKPEKLELDKLGCNFSVGFSTASKKPIKISSESLEKADALFQDFEEEQTPNTANFSVGFATASKKPIKISDASLKKAESMFKEIDNHESDNDDDKSLLTGVSLSISRSKKTISSLESADKKEHEKIKVISKKRRKNCFKPPKPIDKTRGVACNEKLVDPDCKATSIRKCSPNRKSSNMISEESLLKFDMLCSKIGSSQNPSQTSTTSLSKKSAVKTRKISCKDAGKGLAENRKEVAGVGFSTASKKSIKISDASLKKAESLFKSIHQEPLKSDKSSNKSVSSVGFSTASKKPISISAESMKKADGLLKDLDESFDDFLSPMTSRFSVGFSTASKKPIKISKESMEKADVLFQNLDKLEGSLTSPELKAGTEKPMKNFDETSLTKADRPCKDPDESLLDFKQSNRLNFNTKRLIETSDSRLKNTEKSFPVQPENHRKNHFKPPQPNFAKSSGSTANVRGSCTPPRSADSHPCPDVVPSSPSALRKSMRRRLKRRKAGIGSGSYKPPRREPRTPAEIRNRVDP